MAFKPMSELPASYSKPCGKGGTQIYISQAPSHRSHNWMSSLLPHFTTSPWQQWLLSFWVVLNVHIYGDQQW